MKASSLIAPVRIGLLFLLSLLPGLLPAEDIAVTPPPGKAAVVVYRPAKLPGVLMQSNEPYHIGYDAQWISKLTKGRHFVFFAWPGAHTIQPAIAFDRMAADDRRGSSTIKLDVKAGETYYVKAFPPDKTHLIVGGEPFALELMDQDIARKDLADSTSVEWASELVEGTLADVQVLGALDAASGSKCEPVEWTPNIDSVKSSAFKRGSILNGTIQLRDDALLFQLKPVAGESVPSGVTIPYADIASAEIRNKALKRIVMITRKNGRLDSFSVTTAGGGRIDRDQTMACGNLLAGKLGH